MPHRQSPSGLVELIAFLASRGRSGRVITVHGVSNKMRNHTKVERFATSWRFLALSMELTDAKSGHSSYLGSMPTALLRARRRRGTNMFATPLAANRGLGFESS
jgi:hypothetical protein